MVAVVGDGSSLYGIQSLWSAGHYRVGALFVILSNGGYAVMDRLVEQTGGTAPWPGFGVDVAGLARALGCPARSITEHGDLTTTLDDVVARARDSATSRCSSRSRSPRTGASPRDGRGHGNRPMHDA